MPIPQPRLWKKKAILAKIEATSGTEAAPTAADAIEARNVSLTPLEGDYVQDDVARPFLGHSEEIPVSRRVKLSYEVSLQGSGTAGLAPAIGPLLRGCGFAEVTDPDTSVTYNLVSEGQESLTQYINVDGVLHKMLCSRGTVSFSFTPKALAKAKFDFTGLFVPVSDAALPATDMSKWKQGRPVTNAWTAGFSLHGFATAMYDLSLNLGNQVVHRDDVIGVEDVLITDRAPEGSAVIQAPRQAEKDYFLAVQEVTKGALALTHGTAAGLRVKVAAPGVQVKNPTYGEKNGVTTMSLALRLTPLVGNDELTLTFD